MPDLSDSVLPPVRSEQGRTRVPIRWDGRKSDLGETFYSVKEALQARYPERSWSNDAVFETAIRHLAETLQL